MKNATCTYCGCLCDDIELHVERERIVRATHACPLGRAWFFSHALNRPQHAATLVDGRPSTMNTAVEAAAGILERADLPLVYGLGNSTSESQRAAIMARSRVPSAR